MNPDDDIEIGVADVYMKDGKYFLNPRIDMGQGDEPFIEERDGHGHVVYKKQNSDQEKQRQDYCPNCRKLLNGPFCNHCLWPMEKRDDDPEPEFELTEEGMQEKKEPDPEAEPIWTEVKGGASFYYICPACGCYVPGTGPHLIGADGIKRKPKEHHEHYHRTIACDWYFGT